MSVRKQSRHLKLRLYLVNFFGGVGYAFMVLSWVWTLAVMFAVFSQTELFLKVMSPDVDQVPPIATEPNFELPSSLSFLIGAIIIVLVIVACLAILARLPKTVLNQSRAITNKSVGFVVPIIVGKNKLTAPEKRRLSARLTRIIKLALATFPLIVMLTAALLEVRAPMIEMNIALGATLSLSLIAASSFVIQFILASYLRVATKDIL